MRLADLKRLPVGTKLKLVRSLMGAVPPEKQDRIVDEHQSNGMWFKVPWKDEHARSWLPYPKAPQLVTNDDGFSIMEGDEIAAQYQFVTTSSPTTAGGAL